MQALLGTMAETGPLDVPRRRVATKVVVDEALLAEARAACGAATDTATVHKALRALVRAAHEELRVLLGTERGPVVDVPRRREPAVHASEAAFTRAAERVLTRRRRALAKLAK
jgi:Arc/MetJ family transcription regulator